MLLIAMETCASPSATIFKLAITPAEAWLDALIPGTVLFQVFVIAAPTAYNAPEAEAVGKLIFTFSPVVAAGLGVSAFFSPPQPATAETMRTAANAALKIRFDEYIIALYPLKKYIFLPGVQFLRRRIN